MKRLTPQQVNELREGDDTPVIVDVRSREEFEAGHVHGALHIPIGELPERLSELKTGRAVITYCNMYHPGSSRGEKAAVQLEELGFDAGVLEGGFPAWQADQKTSPEPE